MYVPHCLGERFILTRVKLHVVVFSLLKAQINKVHGFIVVDVVGQPGQVEVIQTKSD